MVRALLSCLIRRSLAPGVLLLAAAALSAFVAWRDPTTVLLATGGLRDPVAALALLGLLGLRITLLAAAGPWLLSLLVDLWSTRRQLAQ